jgi:CheY-like chemotaxis protein
VHVLVVDDHQPNLLLLTMLLEGDGHQVTGAASVAEVHARLEQLVPDTILMDVRLPDGDGLEVVRELRAQPRFAGVRMYAVTAHLMGEARRQALAAGCDGFFEKPLDTAKLLATLRS